MNHPANPNHPSANENQDETQISLVFLCCSLAVLSLSKALVILDLESGFGSFPGGSSEDFSRRIRMFDLKTWILASRGQIIRNSTL